MVPCVASFSSSVVYEEEGIVIVWRFWSAHDSQLVLASQHRTTYHHDDRLLLLYLSMMLTIALRKSTN